MHGAAVHALAIWWGSWLAWPALLMLVWSFRCWREWPRWRRLKAGLVLALLLLFLDARFLEPQMIVVHHTALAAGASARIALISDLHLGLYKDPRFIERVVDRLNGMPLDAVLIAGDFKGQADGRPVRDLLAPLARLRHPTYAVRGNHDSKQAPQVDRALEAVGVHLVQQGHAVVGGFTLVGLGDRWSGEDTLAPVKAAPHGKPILALMHNPDSAMQFTPGMVALALAGHTHGGQLRIPGLYRLAIPCTMPFDRGLHRFAPVPVFVTSGLGETAVPLRLFNPPVIDVLELH
jgi:uncharacterized protein